jgi:hypothetical protein
VDVDAAAWDRVAADADTDRSWQERLASVREAVS